MNKEEVRVFSPATVSNVGPGFDLMGFALEAPGDEMTVRRNSGPSLVLTDLSGCGGRGRPGPAGGTGDHRRV
jgi:homoserine kinase